jgi:hypothetical protein
MKEKPEKERRKSVVWIKISKKDVVVIVVASSCTEAYEHTYENKEESRFLLYSDSTSSIHHLHLKKNEFNLSHIVASFRI